MLYFTIDKEKIVFYSWIWELVDGVRVIKDMKVQIKVHDSEILQISVAQSSRTLGVHVTLALSWKS